MPHITHYVASGALELAYHQSGAGFPLLLLHGYTGSKLDFQDQLADFDDLRTVIAPDQRGHGQSSQQGPYTLGQLTYDLLQFLDTLNIDRCDLLGHSMGGMIALRAAAAQPERFRSLILMDTSATAINLMSDEVAAELADLVRAGGCQELLPLMQMGAAKRAVQRGIDFLGKDEHWRRIRQKLSQLDPIAYIDLQSALKTQRVDDATLAAITCPTTVIVGEKDVAFRKPADHLAATIPDARLSIIRHAAHSPQYENHSEWRDAVRAHLQRF